MKRAIHRTEIIMNNDGAKAHMRENWTWLDSMLPFLCCFFRKALIEKVLRKQNSALNGAWENLAFQKLRSTRFEKRQSLINLTQFSPWDQSHAHPRRWIKYK